MKQSNYKKGCLDSSMIDYCKLFLNSQINKIKSHRNNGPNEPQKLALDKGFDKKP